MGCSKGYKRFYWAESVKEELHFLDCVNTHWVSWDLSRGQTTGDHSRLQEVTGIWVTGTSRVFRQGVEIVMFFDIMLKCLVWCMDEAGDQLSGGPQSGGVGNAGTGLQDKHAATRCISHPWDIPHPTPAEWSGLF